MKPLFFTSVCLFLFPAHACLEQTIIPLDSGLCIKGRAYITPKNFSMWKCLAKKSPKNRKAITKNADYHFTYDPQKAFPPLSYDFKRWSVKVSTEDDLISFFTRLANKAPNTKSFSIWMRTTSMNKKSTEIIGNFLSMMPGIITFLDLGYCGIKDAHIQSLESGIKKSTALREIYFNRGINGSGGMTDKGVQTLINILKSNKRITHLGIKDHYNISKAMRETLSGFKRKENEGGRTLYISKIFL